MFLFRVNRDVSEDIVKNHMNGKDLKYVSIKTMSNAEAVFKSFLSMWRLGIKVTL